VGAFDLQNPAAHGLEGDEDEYACRVAVRMALDTACSASACAAFRETVDPRSYVPRTDTEDALDALAGVFRGDDLAGVLCGPPGLGKTLVLRLLEGRHRDVSRPVYLPYASLELDELWAWTLGLLGQPRVADVDRAVEDLAREGRQQGRPLVLLIDEANSMPLDTARGLGERVAELSGDLRLVLTAPDDARTSRVVAALGLDVLDCALRAPLSADETHRYVSERLREAGAPSELFERLRRPVLRRLHGLSGGNPRRLLVLASEVIRGEAGEAVLQCIEPAWSELAGEPDCAEEPAPLEVIAGEVDILDLDEIGPTPDPPAPVRTSRPRRRRRRQRRAIR